MRDIRIEYAHGRKRSRISRKVPGFYNGCTVSLLKDVPMEVSNKEIIKRWDKVCLTKVGELRWIFSYYELLDAETTAREDYRVTEHNKGNWAIKK